MTIRRSLNLSNDQLQPTARVFIIDGTISKKCFDRALKKAGLRKQQLVVPSQGNDGIVYRYKGEFLLFLEQANGDIHVRMMNPALSEELGLPWIVLSPNLQ
jgi:hypothetical protein